VIADVTAWLKGINTGTTETIVTSEGKGWSFNNKNGRHFLQVNDVTRREPNGRYKRVYKGKINGLDETVTHNGVTSDLQCREAYRRWCTTPYGQKVTGGGRTDAGRTGDGQGRDEQLAVSDAK
jgi:hypothetical protein